MELSDFMNSINVSKKNIIRGSESEAAAVKAYPAFVVLRSLSYHKELIPLVELANMYQMGPQQQYEFLLGTVPKGKRFAKWGKWPKDDMVKKLVEVQKISYDKARELVMILNDAQLVELTTAPDTGGY